MKKLRCLCLLLLLAGTSPAWGKTSENEWFLVDTPDTFMPGERILAKVTLKKDLPKGSNLSMHLHWFDAAGKFGGMFKWHRPLEPKKGETVTFNYRTEKEINDRLAALRPILFVAPGADYKKASVTFNPAEIKPAELTEAQKARIRAMKRPATATFKKSTLNIVPMVGQTMELGKPFTVKVEYELSPSDNWGEGTKIMLQPLGPWIDNPDGKINTRRMHVSIPGIGRQTKEVTPGKGVVEFTFTLRGTHIYDELAFRCKYIGGDEKEWPWEVRRGGPAITRSVRDFTAYTRNEGGLIGYGEQPVIELVWSESRKKVKTGQEKEVFLTVYDSEGTEVATASQKCVVGDVGTCTPLTLPPMQWRGTYGVAIRIDDLPECYVYFSAIPDVRKALGGKKTPFGVTNLGSPEGTRVAARLGFSMVRLFQNWNQLEASPGKWTTELLDEDIKNCLSAGIQPWICLYNPPEWIMPPDVHAPNYEPFPFDEAAYRRSVQYLTKRYRGKIWGFEWLNEIVQGKKTKEPVKDYLDFVRIGNEVMKKNAPEMKSMLAGGLWPRTYLKDLILAGVLEHVDVLPIHYGGYDAVRTAIGDVASGGRSDQVEVWDNETARGMSVWNMKPTEALPMSLNQCRWVLRAWPSELIAGAKRIIYFGGEPQSAGNWTYLVDKTTPRPVTATLAVLISKIGTARPVGGYFVEPGAYLYVFERKDGGMVSILAPVDDTAKETRYTLPSGGKSVLVTDYRGREQELPVEADGKLKLSIGAMPVILEGELLPPLAVQTALAFEGADSLTASPVVRIVQGAGNGFITVFARNPLTAALEGELSLKLDAGTTVVRKKIALKPGENKPFELSVAEALGGSMTGLKNQTGTITLSWNKPASVRADKTFRLEVVRPEELGNLLKNGNMEESLPGKEEKLAVWGSKDPKRTALGGTAPGYEGHALKFAEASGYVHASQSLELPSRGKTYLYSAWVWTDQMTAGSNVHIQDIHGGETKYTMHRIFSTPVATPFWMLMTKQLDTEAVSKSGTFVPVAIGEGHALYDNVRLTISDGSDYATEAYRTKKPITVDGSLSDWNTGNPIPLLCANQIISRPGYSWSPENLSGVAYAAWDDSSLYLAVRVRDDKHVPVAGDDAATGDSLEIAFHPTNRAPGMDANAMEWILSTASPGGGSGKYTVLRPAARSGGMKSGQLAKDSSVYDIAIAQDGEYTVYEIRIPWTDAGGFKASLGAKAGLSLRLNDNDGNASGAAVWGGGLVPTWAPSGFGVLTLTE